jgi:dihydrofolate reductase
MRNVILQEFVTLDGFAAASDGSVDFVPAATTGDQSFGQRQMEFMESIDAILLGRVTYTMFAGYWPNVTSGDDRPFADKINAIPKAVFSKTLGSAPWGRFDPATVVKSDAAKEVAKLKQAPGKDMVIWGSISLAQSLMDEGLIDEYQLIVCPVVMGRGKHLFRDARDAPDLKLLTSKAFDRGTVLLAYATAQAEVAAARR